MTIGRPRSSWSRRGPTNSSRAASQYDDLPTFRAEQGLLRRLASESILPVLELHTTEGDIEGLCSRVADGMAQTGGPWPREAASAG